jgi:hypothetical protein
VIQQGWLYYIFVSSLFVPPLNLMLTVIEVKDNTITVQEGNLDGISITFQDLAKKVWQSKSYTLDQFRFIYGGVVFANPK